MRGGSAIVVGGGPAGMVCGLLLARAGVTVTVLEKHADFFRDFRGDTVHPSTLTLLDELGLGPAFDQLPYSKLERVRVPVRGGGDVVVADLTRLRHRTPTTRPPDRSSSRHSVPIRKLKVGSASPAAASTFRKSHCGVIAM